jgi:hypothetical protein
MLQVTLPVPWLGLTVRVELVRRVYRPANDAPRRPSPRELREAFRRDLPRRLLRDVGLDDSRSD